MNFMIPKSPLQSATHSRGLSLIELLVAVTIAGLLIFGATQVYVDSRKTYEINETTARLQETARYALSVLEPDLRMANYWGLLKGSGLVIGQATPSESAASVASGTEANACGTNFAVNIQAVLQATNGSYPISSGSCSAYKNGGSGSGTTAADTITVRRAAVATSAAETNRLQVCSNRTTAFLFSNGASGGCPSAGSQINNLLVDMYYVSRDSTQQAGLPSLRRKVLVKGAGGPEFNDEEIIPDIEDMQVQFGIDPTGVTGTAARYVNADAAIPLTAQIVSVRIWLLVRAPQPEVGFIDDRIYEYGDRAVGGGKTADLIASGDLAKAFQPSISTDNSPTSIKHYRRLLVSRTIQIRNALGT
jgi:type IV pilus assembly protein PilW